MPKPMRTKPVAAAEVRAYAGKAEEYAAAAANELALGALRRRNQPGNSCSDQCRRRSVRHADSVCERPARTTIKSSTSLAACPTTTVTTVQHR